MAKHHIEATSTVCGAASHSWLPSLATNYRTCGRCRTVEMLIDGQWISPTGRVRRARVIAPTLPWTQLDESDLQAKTARQFGMLAIKVNVPGEETKVMTRRDLGEKLFSWGRKHYYPQLRIRVNGHEHVIVPGESAWRITSFQCPAVVVEAALEQLADQDIPVVAEVERVQREKLLEYGRARGWRVFSFKTTKPEMRAYQFTLILGGSESEWTRFAFCGDYDQICQACELLERDQQGENARIIELSERKLDNSVTLDGVRKWLLGDGQRFGYPAIKFRVEGDGVVYKLVGNEASYRERAEQSSLLWLWNACWAIDYWSKH